MPTSVALGEHFESFVRQQLEGGRYNNSSEVVRAGLRLLEEQQIERELALQAMRVQIDAGRHSGAPIAAHEVWERLEQRYGPQAA